MVSVERAALKRMRSVGRVSRAASVVLGLLSVVALLLAACGTSASQQPHAAAPAPAPASVYVASVHAADTPSGTEKVTVAALDPGSGAVRWRYSAQSLGFDRPSSPEVADGRVYVTSDENVQHISATNPPTGTLTALRATDGTRIWQAQIGPLASRPVVVGDVVYVSAKHVGQSTTTWVYALDAATGKERWHTTLGADAAGSMDSLVLVGGTLYMSSNQLCFDACTDAFLLALRASDGALLWHTSIAGNINIPPPLVQDGRLYTVVREYSDGTSPDQVALLAYGAGDGHPLWTYLTRTQDHNGADQYISPLASNGQVYAVTADALNPYNPGAANYSVTALDGATAAVRWTTPIPPAAQLVSLAAGTLYAESANGNVLTALAADTGHERWHVTLPAPLAAVAPTNGVLVGEGLMIGTHTWSRVLFGLRPGDGHLLWTAPFGASETSVSGPYVPPIAVAAGDTVYVAYDGGSTVAAVAAATGHITWQFTTDGTPVGVTAA